MTVITQYALNGGLDQANPPAFVPPGRLIDVQNYECGPLGFGLERFAGYERFDGRPLPSATTYASQAFDTGTNEPAVGAPVYNGQLDLTLADPAQNVTGRFVVVSVTVTSGSWATNDAAGTMELAVINGSFANNDDIQHPWDTGITYAKASAATDATLDPDLTQHRARTAAAAAAMRTEIKEVFGTGRVYGVWCYKGDEYAWRDSVLATYSGGNNDIPAQITAATGVISGASLMVHGFVITSGDPGLGTAAGHFTYTVTSGTPQAGETLRNTATSDVFCTLATIVGGNSVAWKASLDGWRAVDVAQVRSPVAGTTNIMEFVNYNFGGHSGSEKFYGVDGTNKAFECDGTTITEITTGMTTDTPRHVAARRKALYLAFTGGSVQNSAIGVPTSFTPVVTAAAEFGIGDEVTGMTVIRNDALLVVSKDSTKLIVGAPGASDYAMIDYSNTLGGIEWSLQNVGVPVFLDQEGLVLFNASDTSGGWNRDTVSQLVNKTLLPKRDRITCSVVNRSKNLYRLFFTDGSALSFSFNGNFSAGVGAVNGVSILRFPNVVRTICNNNNAAAPETIHFASDTGYMYRMDSGKNLDGAAFLHQFKTAYDWQGVAKDPYQRATYRNSRLQMEAKGLNINLTARPSFDWGVPSKAESVPIAVVPEGRLGFVLGDPDFGVLGEDTLGGTTVPIAKVPLAQQSGVSMSMYIYGNAADEDPHTIFGIQTEFDIEGREQYR